MPRHALLISDNPASAPPQRTLTALDGTAEVRLRAGNYTVESDQPLIFQGKAYQWIQTLDIAAGTGEPGLTVAKLAAYLLLMLVVGQRIIPWILHYVAHSGSRELFRLAVLVLALGVAFGSAELFGVSFALGAFFAGMVLAESTLSQQAAQENECAASHPTCALANPSSAAERRSESAPRRCRFCRRKRGDRSAVR